MRSLLPTLLAPLLSLLLWASPSAAEAEAPLFDSDALLEVSLVVDFEALCRPRETDDCEFSPSTLQFRDNDGEKRSLPVEIKVRGGWRSLSKNCSVPLLWVRFAEADVAGTLFEGQQLLPLTTHCGKGLSVDPTFSAIRRSDYEQYLLREYLGHRLYNALTEYSLQVRLLRIVYLPPGKHRGVPHYAFFSEHFDAAAARTGAMRPERGGFDAERLEPQSAARLALFQFMIGNTDWSIARERNTMLLEDTAGRQIPVPYDLDMSGLVNALYAGPAPGLPIDNVRDRHFLGYCQPGIDWAALFAHFESRRASVLSMGGDLPGFSRNSERSTHRYLASFYELLDTPEDRSAKIVEACQPWPPADRDHTTPPSNLRGMR